MCVHAHVYVHTSTRMCAVSMPRMHVDACSACACIHTCTVRLHMHVCAHMCM